MRYKHPKAGMGANGIYGGVGSRPAHEAWTPSSSDQPAEREPVPEALRRLRLRRTRPRRTESEGAGNGVGLAVMILCIAFAVVVFLVGFGILDLPLI